MTDTYPAPLDDAALAAAWAAAWSSMGRTAPTGLLGQLMTAWSEPHRHYHDQRHLRECMALWTRWRAYCRYPGEVAIALWFHDAVYDPQAPQVDENELNSAAWAARALVAASADSDTAQRVHDLVMATAHAAPHDSAGGQGSSLDAELLVDIDLAILGSPPERFERYDQDVRKEYAGVPAIRYRAGRARVLQGFMDRPRLYRGEQAVALLEGQARINLAAAISRLAL